MPLNQLALQDMFPSRLELEAVLLAINQTFTKQHRKAERLGYCCFLSIKLCSFFGLKSPQTRFAFFLALQMWLPELLGLGDDEVQTTVNLTRFNCFSTVGTCRSFEPQVSEHIEPLDARKTRALTLENMKLTREVERLRGHQVPLSFLLKFFSVT